jgi:tRNA(fMet)-specific endonuclease VapC
MKYLFDTDHLSILQRRSGDADANLSARIARHRLSDFAWRSSTEDSVMGTLQW